MATQSQGKSMLGIGIVIVLAVIGLYVLTAPDRRTPGEKVGDAIDQLGDRTPAQKLGDDLKDATKR